MIYFITFFLLVNISSLLKNARSYKNSKVLLDVECFHRPNFPTHLLRLSLGPSKGEIFNRKIFPLLDMDPKFGKQICRYCKAIPTQVSTRKCVAWMILPFFVNFLWFTLVVAVVIAMASLTNKYFRFLSPYYVTRFTVITEL